MPITEPSARNQNGRSGAKATPPRHIDAILIDDAFGDGRPHARHPIGEPGRHMPAMQRQIRESRPLHRNKASTRCESSPSVMRVGRYIRTVPWPSINTSVGVELTP